MGEREIKKSNCHFCGYLCAMDVTVEDGRAVEIKPDVTRYPYDERVLAGCRRWPLNLDFLDDENRVNHPLRRAGERGAGVWERVSWEEALDDIAKRLSELRTEHNAGVLASMIGGPHTSFWPLHRFMSLFGSPNNVGIGQICWNPRIWMDVITFGWTVEADITAETGCMFIWGTNPAESDNSLFWRTIIKTGKDESVKLVVIDPRFTKTARQADLWLAPSPGTDTTLALGLIHVIIERKLYDKAFVNEWCSGFDELIEHVKPFTPEHVERVCGVPAQDVITAATWFAERSPSALVSGRGVDQVGACVAPTHRALCILRAITGNIDRPGSCILAEGSDFVPEVDLELSLTNFDALNELCLNTDVTPLQCYEGYKMVEEVTERLGRKLPARYLTSAHPDLVLRAMETADPYPIRALIVEATNPLLTYADTHRVYDALMGLDLIVVLDYFLTPTAQLADYVLPSASAIERPTFQAHGGVANFVYGGDAAVEPYHERKTDYEIFRELGLRLGQDEHWPDPDFASACERALAPSGFDWEAYCEIGAYFVPPAPFKHLMPDADGAPKGFATRTGKIELASEMLEALGGERLPTQGAHRSLCTEAFVRECEKEGWKHVDLITGGRKQPYNASMYLHVPVFRASYPEPLVEMSEATAREIGVDAGDYVTLATTGGDAMFKVAIIPMKDGLVHADYGWWYPERPYDPKDMQGIWESNINMLTSCSLEDAEPMIGTWSYNAIDCMIKKA